MRIAGGMDLSQYAGVLDTALADVQPVEALLTTAASAAALDLETVPPPGAQRLGA